MAVDGNEAYFRVQLELLVEHFVEEADFCLIFWYFVSICRQE